MNRVKMLALLAATALPLSLFAGDSVQNPASPASDKTVWQLRMPQNDRLEHRGLPAPTGATAGTNAMVYPAPDAVGFLAGVLTHGLIVGMTQQDEKERQRALANRVWQPYEAVIDGFGFRELLRRAIPKADAHDRLVVAADGPGAQGLGDIESVPVYGMTQDQRAIILDNAITIHHAPGTTAQGQHLALRVVSTPRDTEDPVAYWTDGNGERLKEEKATLMALSLDIALRNLADKPDDTDAPFRTVRYFEGGSEKMERAQVLARQCGRLLLRTLRGTLMSVPSTTPDADSAECKT